MTNPPAPPRTPTAGVTLVEMLVVLALIAVVSGAVVMALPARQAGLSPQISAASLASDINHAMDVTLASRQGFAIAVEDDEVRFLQQSADSTWQPHTDPFLKEMKLFSTAVRLFDQESTANVVFAVSPALVPEQSHPLRLLFGDEETGSVLTYDGASVRVD